MRLKLRSKVLIVMLIIGITPLVISAFRDIKIVSDLGATLAQQSGEALSAQTRANMEQIADTYAARVDRERQLIELLVRLQARAVQQRLSLPVGQDLTIAWASDFDQKADFLELETSATKYTRINDQGERVNDIISRRFQVLFAPPDVKRETITGDARKLSGLTEFYREAHQQHGDIVYRQYTALESGLISTYPGHGGYPADFDPRDRDWYQQQKSTQDLLWYRSHTDLTSRHALINATMPIFDDNGDFYGVTGIDVRLTSLLESFTLPAHLGTNSEVLLVVLSPEDAPAAHDIFVVAKSSQKDTGGHWRELPTEPPLDIENNADYQYILRSMRAGGGGYLRMNFEGQDVFCVFRPFGENRSHLMFIVPAAAVIDPAIRAAEYAMASTKRKIDELVPIAIAIVFAVAFFAWLTSRAITRPIKHLHEAATRLGEGDFDVKVAIETGDELEVLGNAFNDMVPRLEEHAKVREALSIASEVQHQLLPPSDPCIDGIDIAGFSLYCDQTGGDYYDFIELSNLEENRLVIALGDVSGHGIASALLMTTARALLHGIAATDVTPAAALQHINSNLARDVQGGRFMTLFYMAVDVENGRVEWASAGHDPAFHYVAKSDSFQSLVGDGIPLGIDSSWRYNAMESVTIATDDIVFMGTDGIWETRNEDGEFFGKERLEALIVNHRDDPIAALCDRIVESLTNFRGNVPQADDITAVAFRLTG